MTSTIPMLQGQNPGNFAELVAILLLVIFLLEYEIIRFYRPNIQRKNPVWVVILPLFLVFGFIIISRLVQFYP